MGCIWASHGGVYMRVAICVRVCFACDHVGVRVRSVDYMWMDDYLLITRGSCDHSLNMESLSVL